MTHKELSQVTYLEVLCLLLLEFARLILLRFAKLPLTLFIDHLLELVDRVDVGIRILMSQL